MVFWCAVKIEPDPQIFNFCKCNVFVCFCDAYDVLILKHMFEAFDAFKFNFEKN
jgi:hypothetical protein